MGSKCLKSLGVTLKSARKEVEKYIGRGTGFVASEIPFTPRAKRVLEMAVQEGKDLENPWPAGAPSIGPSMGYVRLAPSVMVNIN